MVTGHAEVIRPADIMLLHSLFVFRKNGRFMLKWPHASHVGCHLNTGYTMGTITRLTLAEYEKLPEREGTRYELDEGTLLMEPSPALRHNLIRQRIAEQLTGFVRSHHLGLVVEEMDFRLGPDTVRNPDVAFISAEHLRNIDPDYSPVEGAPALAIEVISPTNLAQDTAKKVRQYLDAGSHAVWLVYPTLRLIEIHDSKGARRISEPESLEESRLFAGFKFSLSLTALFDDILRQ
jgi:Uma2 family endonuclease